MRNRKRNRTIKSWKKDLELYFYQLGVVMALCKCTSEVSGSNRGQDPVFSH
jgi:hypothetical protein